MKKIVIFLFLFFSLIEADSVLLMKKGWQLVGASESIDTMSKFTLDEVEELWHFDAKTQTWLGYSPDATIQAKMEAKGIKQLTALKNWHGFWVKSKKEWALALKSKVFVQTPTDQESEAVIELEKGWNLISLPIESSVSADIFKDMTVWSYNSNNQWELSDKETSEDFPALASIHKRDGLWVKSDKHLTLSVAKEASKLRNFTSKGAMKTYITEMLKSNQYGIYIPYRNGVLEGDVAVPTTASAESDSSASSVQDISGTNLQEAGMDESDILKHNGENIFYKIDAQHIGVTSFAQLILGKKDPLKTISFEERESIDSFYLVNNRLVVLLNAHYPYVFTEEDASSTSPKYDSQKNRLVMYDVSNIASIEKSADFKIDGYKVDSRVVGDNLYFISNFSPKVEITYPKEHLTLSPECKEYFNRPQALEPSTQSNESNSNEGETSTDDAPIRIKKLLLTSLPYDPDKYGNKYASCYSILKDTDGYYRYNYEKPDVKVQQLLPTLEDVSITTSTQDLVTASHLYAPIKQNQSVSITTISRFSIASGAYKNSSSFVGNSSVRYASANALYLVSTEYPFYYDYSNFKLRSMVYKFSLDDTLDYKGRGVVFGTTLNQFSLSEADNILRIATTEGFSWSNEGTKNTLYTLEERNNALSILGLLSGLGKEKESIKSVRFMGKRAYIVTFEQTDPFYTIDLSNPLVPKKVGELEVSGFSSYLHPIGENLVLGFGRDADAEGNTKGIKLELFDVSDFAHPTSLDTVVLSNNTYSELEYNHKALAYRTSDNLLAFPYREFNNVGENEYLGIYQVKDNSLLTYKAIVNSNTQGWGENRGLIFDKNATTYVSFFGRGSILTEVLNKQ